MTHPLYYDNPTATEFSAAVIEQNDDGTRLVLDQTLFYPEGGGQPGDRGTIDGIRVTDTQKGDGGAIVHHLAEPTATRSGDTVRGVVDEAHRFDYMQQHTGQHVLSAALMHTAGAATVSVAQGSEVTSIEVDAETLSDELIAAIEDTAVDAIRRDLPVTGFWIDDTELEQFPLRRPTSRTGRIRLVRIGGADRDADGAPGRSSSGATRPYDLVACGGVHLSRTGLLNLVATVGVERIRGRLRLHFKIGNRAIRDYRHKHRAVSAAAELFSTQPPDLPERIRQEQTELQELRRTARIRAERLAEMIIDAALRGSSAEDGPPPVPAVSLRDEDPDVFKALVETAADRPSFSAFLATNITGGAIHWGLVVADTDTFPAERLRKELLAPFGAKGGGKPPLWRGIIPLQQQDTDEEAERSSASGNSTDTAADDRSARAVAENRAAEFTTRFREIVAG